MHFDLSDEQQAIRTLVRDFATGEVAPVAEELDRTKAFPYEIVAKLGELGLMGIPYPEEYGGGGADNLSYALAIEELARVDSSVGITLAAHTSLGTWPIYAFGSEEQKAEWMPRLCSGERLGAFGLTEPEAGSDAGNVRTRATLEDGDWVINGAKQFITNSGTDISGFVTITARTGEDEISNLLVPNGTPGYEIGEPYRKMGWNASDTRPLTFEDCRVPEENLVGPRGMGFRQFLQTLDGGRIGVAAMGVGPRAGRARRGARVREGARRVRPADRLLPGDPGQARRHLDRDRGRPPAHLQGGRCSRTRAATSASPRHRRSSRPAGSRSAPPRRRCRSTAATATSRSTRSAASTATPRSSRSARAPTRSSRW